MKRLQLLLHNTALLLMARLLLAHDNVERKFLPRVQVLFDVQRSGLGLEFPRALPIVRTVKADEVGPAW